MIVPKSARLAPLHGAAHSAHAHARRAPCSKRAKQVANVNLKRGTIAAPAPPPQRPAAPEHDPTMAKINRDIRASFQRDR
jgi:hypothetical protein